MSHPNIFAMVIHDLHPKIRDYLEELKATGQIDVDANGHPHLISVDRAGGNHVVKIGRNNKIENFVINSRKKAAPILSWNESDGFVRKSAAPTQVTPSDRPNGERERRRVYEAFVKAIF